MIKVAIYVSNHGYGHASRVSALAAELGKWGIFCHIVTDRPAFLFRDLDPHLHSLHNRRVDFGVIHQANLVTDLQATKNELLRLMNSRNQITAVEVEFIRNHSIDLIISDASYLIAEAAIYCNLPCYLVSNFDWYYVYSGLFADDLSMRPVLNTIRGLYQLMDLAIRLPFSTAKSLGSVRKCHKMGILARNKAELAASLPELEIPAITRILLVMFGGEGAMELDYEKLCRSFPGIVISTRENVNAPNHRCVPVDADFLSLIHRSEIILCKPGYSTFAEAVQENKFIIYSRRHHYPEEDALVEGLKYYPNSLELPSLKLSAKDWQALFAQIKPSSKPSGRFKNRNTEVTALIVNEYLRQRYPHAKLLSVFDVGTNNLNYNLFDLATDRVLHKSHLTTGLGIGFAEGMLSAASITRTIEVSKALFALDATLDSQKVIIATGISRMAKNTGDFTNALQHATKINPIIISPPSEIRYGFYAAAKWGVSRGTNLAVDIGGATTEFIFFTSGTRYEGLSLDLGLLRLYEVSKSLPKAADYIRNRLKDLPEKYISRIIGIGLTYYYLALVIYQLHNPQESEVNGLIISKASLLELQTQMESGEEDEYLPYLINSQYQPILALSVAYSISLLDRFQLSEILVCTDGISVGYGHWMYLQLSRKAATRKNTCQEKN